ncbi:MAG: O-antigen ligase family protein [Verrucomicrobiales bacterium]|nr:O-antigen ligase family protein [Verrucomicrobiales bacterium]
MNLICRFAVITIFLAGLVTVGILGTSASMTFVWPGYLVIGLSGIASVIAIFRRTKYIIPSWCMIAAFGFAGYLLVRAMGSPVAYFAREDGALLITCFIAYAVFLSMLDDSRWRRGLFWCIVSLLVLNCGMAMVQLISGSETWLLSGYERTFPDRIGGLFNHPEHFAGLLAIGIPFLISAIIFGRQKKPVTIGLGILCAFCLIGIILSKSLLGFMAAAVGVTILGAIVVFLCWRKLVFRAQKSILMVCGILGVLTLGFVFQNFSRVGNLIDQKILTREGQISLPGIWSSSLEQFAEAPLAGTGSRTFYFFSRKFRPEQEGTASFETEFVHNEYLQLLADYGIIGLTLGLTFILLHFYNGMKFVLGYVKFQSIQGSVLPKSDHLALVAGALTAIGTVAFLAMFDFVIHIPAIALLATILIGVLACPDPMSRALQPKEEDTYIPGGSCLFLGRGLAFGCGVALTLFSCIFSRSEWHLEMAKVGFESGEINSEQLKHLERARKIDPQNPHAMTWSAHSLVGIITPEMSDSVRRTYLEKAEEFFSKAEDLYPQDIDTAIAHSVVLDALGKTDQAADRIRLARLWAPLHGNLLIAQAEHFLRNGELDRAEKSYEMARDAKVFPNLAAVEEGLLILEARKAEMDVAKPTQLTGTDGKTLKDGKIGEVEFSGDINSILDESIRKLESKLGSEAVEIDLNPE